MTTLTRSQEVASNIEALLRARNSCIHVSSSEEARVEGYLIEAAGLAGYKPMFWDVAQGVSNLDGSVTNPPNQDPGEVLTAIKNAAAKAERVVWILRDFAPWL